MPADQPGAVWQGRVASPLDPRARALNDSLAVDARLAREELALTRAYARALVEAGVMSEPEADALAAASDALEADLESGSVSLEGEDIGGAVEADLARRCGDPALRLHTGRSRNDQVATLLRMRLLQQCDDAVEHLREVERALVTRARGSLGQPVAAYTHLQPAQPVLLAHRWLS